MTLRYADAVRELGGEPRSDGGDVKLPCPHCPTDADPSLNVGRADDGGALLFCHRDDLHGKAVFCDLAKRLDEGPADQGRGTQRSIRARHTYRNADGTVFAVKIRYAGETKPKAKWDRALGGKPAPLYRLPELIEGLAQSARVHLVEGEGDADALARLGLVAISIPNGASKGKVGKKWREDWTDLLAGHDVVIIADNDQPGINLGNHIAQQLGPRGGAVRVLTLSPPAGGEASAGYDVSDFLSGGGDLVQLGARIEAVLPGTLIAVENGPAKSTGKAPRAKARLAVRRLADVRVEAVHWLWPDRIPYAGLTLWAGEPGLGKSTGALDIAARQSRGGRLPGGWPIDPGRVLIFAAEDRLEDTIVPRLIAAEADLDRIDAVAGVLTGEGDTEKLGSLYISEHSALIRAEVEQINARTGEPGERVRLVVIDPLQAYCGSTDSHRDAAMRSEILAPLGAIAQDTGAAVLIVTHLNKGGGRAINRVGGSIGIIGAVRSAWFSIPDPDDPGRVKFVLAKSNLARSRQGNAYTVESVDVATHDGGTASVGRIEWEVGELDEDADDALAALHAQGAEDDRQTELDRAISWLVQRLTTGDLAGMWQRSADVKDEAREVAGVSARTFDRAKAEVTQHGALRSQRLWPEEAVAANDHTDLDEDMQKELAARDGRKRPWFMRLVTTASNAGADEGPDTRSPGPLGDLARQEAWQSNDCDSEGPLPPESAGGDRIPCQPPGVASDLVSPPPEPPVPEAGNAGSPAEEQASEWGIEL